VHDKVSYCTERRRKTSQAIAERIAPDLPNFPNPVRRDYVRYIAPRITVGFNHWVRLVLID